MRASPLVSGFDGQGPLYFFRTIFCIFQDFNQNFIRKKQAIDSIKQLTSIGAVSKRTGKGEQMVQYSSLLYFQGSHWGFYKYRPHPQKLPNFFSNYLSINACTRGANVRVHVSSCKCSRFITRITNTPCVCNCVHGSLQKRIWWFFTIT